MLLDKSKIGRIKASEVGYFGRAFYAETDSDFIQSEFSRSLSLWLRPVIINCMWHIRKSGDFFSACSMVAVSSSHIEHRRKMKNSKQMCEYIEKERQICYILFHIESMAWLGMADDLLQQKH